MSLKPADPLRAWAWHLILWAAAAAGLYTLIWAGAWLVWIAGAAIGLTAMVAVVLAALATATWWASGRARP